MGERLAGGNVAIALLGNTIAIGAALVALILALIPEPTMAASRNGVPTSSAATRLGSEVVIAGRCDQSLS